MSIFSSMGAGSGHNKPEKWASLTAQDVECDLQPLFIRPTRDEEKIRRLMNMPQCLESETRGVTCECQCVGCCCDETDQALKRMNISKKTPSYWHEVVMLEGFPMESVRANWASHHRCVVISARTAQMDKTWNTVKSSSCGPRTEHFMKENVSPLTPMSRWTNEKNLHRMKRILPVPNFVCAKDLECFLDTTRNVIIVCARRPHHRATSEQSQQPQVNQQQHPWIDKECVIPADGCERMMHQRCQPTKALLKSLLGVSSLSTGTLTGTCSSGTCPPFGVTCSEEWHSQCKSISEDKELHMASHILRHHMHEVKCAMFPGMLQSPRFKKDEKSGHWSVWLRIRLRSPVEFRPEDVHVHGDEKRNCLVVDARREMRECLTRRSADVKMEIPLMQGDLLDVMKMRCHFGPSEGILCIELPLNRDKIGEYMQQVVKL